LSWAKVPLTHERLYVKKQSIESTNIKSERLRFDFEDNVDNIFYQFMFDSMRWNQVMGINWRSPSGRGHMVMRIYKRTFFTWSPLISSPLSLWSLSLLIFRRTKAIDSENICCIERYETINNISFY
jgi:hypothetical protein